MESPTPMINTQRLKPFCQRTSRTVMSILDNGDVSMEILAKPQSGIQDGTQVVQEVVYISANCLKVQIYQNHNLDGVTNDGTGNMSGWSCQEFVFPDLPQKHLKKYMHAYRFIELVKSRTPKIVLMTDRAKCKLMENSPTPDFVVEFHDDNMSILLSKRKVHITDSDGNSMTSEIDRLSERFPENILERFYYLKQCESECLRLEESFNNLNTRGESPELFPLTIGTSASLVSIPLLQPASLTSVYSLTPPSHVPNIENVDNYGNNSVFPPHQSDSISNQTAVILQQQSIDPSRNLTALETSPTNTSGQLDCLSPPILTQSLSGDRHLSIVPQLEHDFLPYQLSNSGQPSLSHLEMSASNASIPQPTQISESPVNSVPYSFDAVPNFCLPEFKTHERDDDAPQVFMAPSMSEPEGYNKFKYCSQLSPDMADSSQIQLQSTAGELFVQQPDISGLCASGHDKVPSLQDCVDPEPLSADPLILQQNVHFGVSENETPLVSIHSTGTSSGFSFYSQKTDPFSSTHDKRNSLASSSSSFVGAQSSSHIVTKEKLDSSEAFCFSPVQSSSIITTYSDLQSPKKMHRKVASPCVSSLEKEIEHLGLSSSLLDSPGMREGSNSQSFENEEISCLHDIQRTPKPNTKSLSLIKSSSVKTNNSMRSKPDHFNMSLPLYDSKQQALTLSFPFAPQRQFLQTSDNSSDRGNNDYALPPQVRNSLDLSTSSNYSDSPSSSQSSSCEPLYQVFVPYTGWASYYASGAVWVLYNDGTQLGVKASEKTMTFIDQDGSQRKYNNKDIVPDIVKMKLEKFPSVLNAVLNYRR